VPGVDVHQLD